MLMGNQQQLMSIVNLRESGSGGAYGYRGITSLFG